MNSIDVEVVRSAMDWMNRGHRVVLGTVVRTWGSSPRPPGSLMVIRDDGAVAGSVSGGCIEDDLIGRVRRGELSQQRLPQAVVYGADADEARRFGLPCGGTVQIVLEPLSAASRLRELLAAVEEHRVVRRRLELATGLVTLAPAEDDRLRFDGQLLETVHGPRLRLVIVGAGQLGRCLAGFAVALDYRVTVCDPRPEYHAVWEPIDGVTLSTAMPDDLVLAMGLDPHSALVALTHDPKIDDLALMEALRTPAFYVGALGSRRNNDARRERLRQFDVSADEVAALRGPVGLNLGGRTPPEIALAIVAEMTAVRHGALGAAGTLSDWSGSQTACRTAAAAPPDR